MRTVVLIVALVCAASAARAEDARESRYGPRPGRQAAALTTTSTYVGPMLGWAGKSPAGATPGVQPAAPMSEPWRDLAARQQTHASLTPRAMVPAQPQQPMSEPWRNLGAQPRLTTPTPAPYSAPPQAPAANMARTYSVGRQYGLQPDALPPFQPGGMVFIAPSEEDPRPKTDEPRHGSAEWMAAGALGDEAGDAGRRGQDPSL